MENYYFLPKQDALTFESKQQDLRPFRDSFQRMGGGGGGSHSMTIMNYQAYLIKGTKTKMIQQRAPVKK